MMPLPAAKETWRCKNKRKQGYGLCDQYIYKSDKKTRTGKNMVCNAEDGRGGAKDDPHVCPDRLDSKFDHTNRDVDWKRYHDAQRNKMCPGCANRFDSYKFPLCPICFKLECHKCSTRRTWTVGNDNNTCPSCGAVGIDVRQVMNSHQFLYGKYTD